MTKLRGPLALVAAAIAVGLVSILFGQPATPLSIILLGWAIGLVIGGLLRR